MLPFDTYLELMIKRLLFAIASLFAIQGTALSQTVSISGQSLDFSNPITSSPSTSVGGSCMYDNVVTISGTSYDAIITITAVNNALISDFDQIAATNSNTAAHFSPQVLWIGAGSISYTLDFIEDFTSGTPVPAVLGDFYLTAWDLDGVGPSGAYFETQGLTSYTLGTSSVINYTSSGPGQGTFTNGNTSSNTVGTDGTSRVTVGYSSASSVAFSIGSSGSGSKTHLISGANPTSWFPTSAVETTFPNLLTVETLVPFFTCDGTVSAAQSVVVEGRYLTDSVLVTAPTGYSVSMTAAGSFSSSLVLSADSTGQLDTTFYLAMNGLAPISNPASVLLTSSGASTATLSVSGIKGGLLGITNFTKSDPTACGANDGTITFNVENVVDGSYVIRYLGGNNTAVVSGGLATVSGLSEGHYTDVILIDVNGCSTATGFSVSLLEPIDFTVAYSPSDQELCIGDAATFGAVAVGTTTLQWRNFASNSWSNISSANSSTYTTNALSDTSIYDVQITSATGCRWTSLPVAAQVHPNPSAALVSTPASCPGTTDGSIDLTITAGLSPMSFLWSNGANTEDLTSVASGTYSVTLLDPIGCEGAASVSVSDSDGVAPVVYAMDITVQLDSLGIATITPGDVDSASSDNCSLTLSLDSTTWGCSDIGLHTVMLIGTDGTYSDTAFAVVTVLDTLGPTITCGADTTLYVGIDTSGTGYSWAPAFATDPCGIDTAWASDTAGTWFGIGTHSITSYARDASGNTDSCSFTLTVLDTVAPSFTSCLSDTIMYSDALSCGAELTWMQPLATDNADSVLYSRTDTSGTFFSVGVDTVMIFAMDLSGNTDTCSFTVTIIDTIAPAWDGTLDTLVIQTATDTCGVFTDSVSLTAPTIVEACGLDTLYHNAANYYALGEHDVYWYATDVHGNTDSILQRLVVQETVLPEIYCPGDSITVYADVDSTWTMVTWTGDSVWDNCGIDTSFFSLDKGSYLNIGLYKIDFYAYDLSGNGDTCSFFLTIQDTTAPVLAGLISDTTLIAPQDSCSVPFAWTLPTIIENSTNYTSTSNTASASGNFGIGTHTIYYTVTDAAGYTDSAGFTITVEDQSGPQLYANTQVLTLDAMGFATINVGMVDSGSFDCSGLDSLWLSDTLFVCTDIGSPVVWFYGLDSLGFTDSLLVPITILPNPAGVIQSTLAITDVLCYGESSGAASIGASGGSLPYNYSWSTTDTTVNIAGLSAGSYSYTVSDTNGCTFQANFSVNEPPPFTVSTLASDYSGYGISVEGGNDGTIDATVAGGVSPYVYDWNNGYATTEDLTGLFEGTYFVMVTDSNGCMALDTVVLIEPDYFGVSTTVLSDNICPNGLDGSIYAAYTGGAGPYIVSWSNTETTDTISGLTSGTYYVVVVDNNGVIASDTNVVFALDEDCDGILNIDEGGIPGAGGGMMDTDGDGIPNQQDTDSDGDGIADALEFDSNNDGTGFDDCDGDGTPDFLDADKCTPKAASVLTPDGDGNNDFWVVERIALYPGSVAKIFNRHGVLVWESDNYANDFNGNSNVQTFLNNATQTLPTGTYFYYLRLGGGLDEVINGYIYLNR